MHAFPGFIVGLPAELRGVFAVEAETGAHRHFRSGVEPVTHEGLVGEVVAAVHARVRSRGRPRVRDGRPALAPPRGVLPLVDRGEDVGLDQLGLADEHEEREGLAAGQQCGQGEVVDFPVRSVGLARLVQEAGSLVAGVGGRAVKELLVPGRNPADLGEPGLELA